MNADQSMYDRQALAKEYGVSESALEAITKQARHEFGDDEMMVELHVLRAIRRMRFDESKKAAQA